MNIKEAIAYGVAALKTQGVIDSPQLDCEVLLGHVLGRNSAYLISHSEMVLGAAEWQGFVMNIERRQSGEPVAYILGQQEFWSQTIEVDARVLIPRPDTELLVERALVRSGQTDSIIDLGTGSGAVAIALAIERPGCVITAVDVSACVLAVAKHNIARLGIQNIRLVQSSWYDGLDDCDSFDVVVSNPPYVKPDDPHLRTGLRFEPRSALVAGNRGLQDLQCIIAASVAIVRPGGWLLVEHACDQGAEVRESFIEHGYCNVTTYPDLSSNERVTEGRPPE